MAGATKRRAAQASLRISSRGSSPHAAKIECPPVCCHSSWIGFGNEAMASASVRRIGWMLGEAGVDDGPYGRAWGGEEGQRKPPRDEGGRCFCWCHEFRALRV